MSTALRARVSARRVLAVPLAAAAALGAASLATSSTVATSPIPPYVSAVSPDHGPAAGGNEVKVTISGNFSTPNVRFGEQQVWLSQSQAGGLVAVVPPGRAGTTVDVVAVDGGKDQTWGPKVTYTYDGRTRYAITPSPASGTPAGGTAVTLTGADIDWRTVNAVWFGKQAASITSATKTQAVVSAPAGTPGSKVDITARTSNGEVEGRIGDRFTYDWTSEPPVVTEVTPKEAYPRQSPSGGSGYDDRITVRGQHLKGATQVTVGGEPIEFVESDPCCGETGGTRLSFTSPYRGPGVVDIRVTTPRGTSANTAADDLTIKPRPGLPQVTSISKRSVSVKGGARLVLKGEGLVQVRSVRVDGQSIRYWSQTGENEVTISAPPHASGTVDVTVEALGGTGVASAGSGDDLTYVEPGPLSIDVTQGPAVGGNEITFTGAGYDFESISYGRAVGSPLGGAGYFRVVRFTPDSVTLRAPAMPEGTAKGIELWTNSETMQGVSPTYRWTSEVAVPTTVSYGLTGDAYLPTIVKGTQPVALTGESTLRIDRSAGTVSGKFVFAPAKARLDATAAIPVTATLSILQSGTATGRYNAGYLELTTKVRLKVTDAKLFGSIPLAAGNNCQSKQLSTLKFHASPSDPEDSLWLNSRFDLSDLNGCGPLEGLVSPATASSDNSISLTLQAKG